jgi:hypothetical protein
MVGEEWKKEKKIIIFYNILIGFTVKSIMGWEVCCKR